MKQLLFFLVLIVVLGLGGLVYRNVMERRAPMGAACTLEARICPDGASVGRTGPDCSFAACPLPNMEIPEAGIAFALPSGYTQILSGAPNQNTLRIFSKPSASPAVQHSIRIERYPIPAGKNADDVILANTRYEPADMQATDFSRFTTVTMNGHAFRGTVIERFEAVVESSYFLARGNDVLRFDIVEHDVANWTDANLVVENLSEHQALLHLLGTLQTN